MEDKLQALFKTTHMQHAGHGGLPCRPSMNPCTITTALVKSCERVEDRGRWRVYDAKRSQIAAEIKSRPRSTGVTLGRSHPAGDRPLTTVRLDAMGVLPDLCSEINEVYVWHGFDYEHLEAIKQSGLDFRRASDSGLYGSGSYFAENSCKCNQYVQNFSDRGSQTTGKPYAVLLCRVVLGDVYHTSTQMKGARLPPANPRHSKAGGLHDSVVACGASQVHREFIVFDNSQVYPEYIVHFEYT